MSFLVTVWLTVIVYDDGSRLVIRFGAQHIEGCLHPVVSADLYASLPTGRMGGVVQSCRLAPAMLIFDHSTVSGVLEYADV